MQTITLKKFVTAQQRDYLQALSEIKAGRKTSHWMWYIFPQLKGLGYSEMASYYGIKDLTEALAYLQHPVLGKNLIEITTALYNLKSNDAHAIFGSPDDLKLKSSMTLFSQVPGTLPIFDKVLQKFYGGEKDQRTLNLLTDQTF